MLWIVLLFLSVLIAGGLGFWLYLRAEDKNRREYRVLANNTPREADLPDRNRSSLKKPVLVSAGTFVGLALLFTLICSFTKVNSGQVGVVYQFGKIDGQLNEGISWIAPWKTVKTANIQTQKETFDQLSAFSKETQDVFVTLSVNYNTSPEAIQNLFRTVGPGYFDKLVPNRLNQIVKDTTVKYSTVDIAPNREPIKKEIRDRLSKELAPFSINVVDVNIDNISFSKEFTQAIEQKQIATQDAQRAKAQVQQAQFEADKTVALAEGQAKANRIIAASLTDQVLQSQAIQKFNDKVQVMLLPSGNGTLIDPSTFLKK